MCLWIFQDFNFKISKFGKFDNKCLNMCRNPSFHPYIQMTNGYVQNVRTDICKLRFFDCISWIIFFETPTSPFDTVFLYITYSKSPFDTVFLYITYSKSPFDTVFLYITYSKSPFDTVLGSLPPPRGLCACLRRFGDLKKNTPLEFGSMYLVDLVNFHRFGVPPTTPWSMCLPAALRRPQKKHVPC